VFHSRKAKLHNAALEPAVDMKHDLTQISRGKALHENCFPRHTPAKDHDYVFADYAP